jgi:hypothetical protein
MGIEWEHVPNGSNIVDVKMVVAAAAAVVVVVVVVAVAFAVAVDPCWTNEVVVVVVVAVVGVVVFGYCPEYQWRPWWLRRCRCCCCSLRSRFIFQSLVSDGCWWSDTTPSWWRMMMLVMGGCDWNDNDDEVDLLADEKDGFCDTKP